MGGLFSSAMNGVFGSGSDSSGEAQALLRQQRERELGMSTAGSQKAEGYMRRAYADAFRLRAATLGVGLAEYGRSFADQVTSQGLNRTVGARIVGQQRYQGQQALGAAGADATQGLNMDLATLAKGTSTEQIGIEDAFTHNYVNSLYQHDATKNSERAGNIGFVASIAGAALGAKK